MNSDTVLTLLGMAGVTYLTRITGVWIVSQLSHSERLKRSISYLPSSVLISIVLPPLLQKGTAEAMAALLTLLSAAVFRNLIVSLITGVISVVVLRNLL